MKFPQNNKQKMKNEKKKKTKQKLNERHGKHN
jgi:hypothetical protein